MKGPKYPPIRISRRNAFVIEIIGTLTVALFVVLMVGAFLDYSSERRLVAPSAD